ncbi:MAG: penicillin-binding protein 1C [Polyangiaceae bacterium]
MNVVRHNLAYLKRVLRRVLPCLVVILSPVYVIAIGAAFVRVPPELTQASAGYEQSARFLDRNDHVLRELRASDMTRASWVSLADAGKVVPLAILAAEDQRFEIHGGVDPLAVARAALGDLLALKVTSGASTLTMQLARLTRPHKRNLLGKIGEAALAVKIEESLTKDQILAEYINRAPFGPNLRGIDAASRYYFDKPPRELSLAEAATLAAIPRGPEVYSLDKHADRALRRRNRILSRMLSAGWISDDSFDRASHEPLFVQKHVPTFGAPHLIAALAQGSLDPALPALRSGDVHTTLSRELQGEAEQAALLSIRSLQKKNVTAASVLVIDNASGDVLAYVGSPDFFDAKNAGQNDGVRARRQPGSTLKPFLYGLAMERLDFTAATVLPDVEMELPLLTGAYEPMNYDERFHGPVRLREALANSFNVPAVWTTLQVGPAAFLDRLHDLGMGSLTEAADYYGPALALGDGEVSLLELTNAYATLARGGVWKPIRFTADLPSNGESSERRVMPASVANVLADILKDKNARLASFGERSVLELPFDVAAKTGTSKGFRDNWTIGFTREVTVGVWVGNFDGSAMDGVSGITGAGPIFRSVMQSAMQSRASAPLGADATNVDLIRVDICPLSGKATTAACTQRISEWIPRAHASLDACDMHEFVRIDSRNGDRADDCAGPSIAQKSFETFPVALQSWARSAHRELAPQTQSPLCGSSAKPARDLALEIASPNDGASYVLDPSRPFSLQSLAVRINAPADATHVRLRVDGRVLGDADASHRVRWNLSPGAHVLIAEADGNPASPPVRVTVQ